MLTLLIHEHEIISPLVSSVSLISLMQFSWYIPFTSLIEFIPRLFIVSDAVVSGFCLFVFVFSLVALGLHCPVWAFSSVCDRWGPLFVVVWGLLMLVISLLSEHRL